jgi:hypothetical protein
VRRRSGQLRGGLGAQVRSGRLVALECSGQIRVGLGAQGFRVNSEEASRREDSGQGQGGLKARGDARGNAEKALGRECTRVNVEAASGREGARRYSEEASECEAASW